MSAEVEFDRPRGPLGGAWALARLVTRPGAQRRAFRSALWSGGMLALFSTPWIVLLSRTSAADATDILALRVLAYASWLVGAFGCWAFLAPDAGGSTTSALARERGFSGEELGQMWTVGVALRLALGIFLVPLVPLVASIALSPSRGLLLSRTLLLPGVAAYALLLGASLAGLGRLVLRITPRTPRLTLAVLVLLPYAAGLWFDDIVSLPGIFGWLLEGLIALGGWAA